MRKKIVIRLLLAVFLFTVMLGGCGVVNEETEKISTLDYTVLGQDEIPQELKNLIEEQKENPIHLTYEDEALYIVVGYGKQKTGGYSIEVEDLYLTNTAICFKTKLIGPGKEEKVEKAAAYPYLVVKTEYRKEQVIFED